VGEARTIHSLYAIGDLSSPLLSRLFRSVSPLRYCCTRACEYGTRSFIIACVTNRLSPAIDIGESSDPETALFIPARVSLVMFPRETTSHLTETLTNVFIRTSAKLRERMRFKRVGNTKQIAFYFFAIGSIKCAIYICVERFRRRLLR